MLVHALVEDCLILNGSRWHVVIRFLKGLHIDVERVVKLGPMLDLGVHRLLQRQLTRIHLLL